MPIRLTLVVTTIGRVPEVLRLARSVAASPVADRTQLVLVDQSEDQRAARALAELDPAVRWVTVTSGRGASVGRNVGLQQATGDVVGFPNDNTWYPAAVLPALLERFEDQIDLGGLCLPLATEDGRPAMLRWATRPGPVRGSTAHRTVIAPGMFLRRDLVERAGGFDERIGTGSAGPVQSGEEPDLVFRVQALGARVEYDPALVVGNDEPRDTLSPAFVTKMSGYGIGQGLIWRRHGLPMSGLAWMLARKLVAAPVRALRGQRLLARADLAWARGCLSGYLLREPA